MAAHPPSRPNAALWLATLATALAIVALVRQPRPAPTEWGTGKAEPSLAIDPALLARVSRLEEQVGHRAAETPLRETADPAALAIDRQALAALAARLDSVEQRLAAPGVQLEQSTIPEPIAAPPPSPEEWERQRLAKISSASDAILAPLATPQSKLEAWARLRRAGPDAWNDAVVLEMARLGINSPDAAVRADVWRQADGNSKSDLIVPSLLQALATDTAANVREEAAETLENYLDQPRVRVALEQAAAHDTDNGVRNQALQSLAKR